MNDSKERKYIHVKGARVHNLKNIEVKIPHNQLVVVTGTVGLGQVDARVRHHLRRGPATLRRKPVGLRPPVSGQDQQARRRPDYRNRSGHRDRAEGQHAESALDRRHVDRNLRLPETALRAHRTHLFARIGPGGPPLHGGRRREPDRLAARTDTHTGNGSAEAGRRAGADREADAARRRGNAAYLYPRRNAFHRGDDPPRGRLRRTRRSGHRRRPGPGYVRRGNAEPVGRLGRERVSARRRHLRDRRPARGGRSRRAFLVAFRAGRHRVRAADRAYVQFQQSGGSLPPVRRLRQSDRHRRGPGRARQDQKHLSGRYRLLAGRNDEMVEGAADSERPEIRLPRPPAVLRAHAPAAASAVERERAFSRTGRVLQIPRKRTLQDTVPRHAVALHREKPSAPTARERGSARKRCTCG